MALPSARAADDTKPQTGDAVQVVEHNGYPELRVDGRPFFIHAATFFYYRIPRDLWEKSLDRYRQLGINTIDLPIPWNWHEPREGEFDFDGHTNPRRNLRVLLHAIAEKGFRLIARPGPLVGKQWRLGGYPDWLLARPEFHMDASARLDGRYPPLAELNPRDAEAAAKGWLENPAYMAAARRWLAAAARELAPYTSTGRLRVAARSQSGELEGRDISGPLLFVQLDDSPGFDSASPAEPGKSFQNYRRYLAELRGALREGGLETRFTVNPVDALDLGPDLTLLDSTSADPAKPAQIARTGQWFLRPPAEAQGEQQLAPRDIAELEFLAEALKLQADFPPVLTDYQAGWYTPADDARPKESAPANTLLSSRLLLAHGVHGLEYSPLQDSLAPAGYEMPETNRYYRWDAALDLSLDRQPRARPIARNGRFLRLWGTLLAAAHQRADFAIVDLRRTHPSGALPRADAARVTQILEQVQRIAQLAGLAARFCDPRSQPLTALLGNALLLLPVPDPPENFQLLEKAQETIAEYVRRGGTLVVFPRRPTGKIFDQLWSAAGEVQREADAGTASWKIGQGHVMEWSKDFYSWVALAETAEENRARFEASWATASLRKLLQPAGARPAVKRSGNDLLVTQLVPNEGTGELGARKSGCTSAGLAQDGQGLPCGWGLLSVTNASFEKPAEETLEILSPRMGMKGDDDDYLSLHVQVPAHESLLLPLHFPLCSESSAGSECRDEIVAAGAEFFGAERDGKILELTFYAPARATILLKLESKPSKISLQEMNLEGRWTVEKQELEVSLPRGAAPDFLRVLKIHLHYTPHVPAIPEPHKRSRRDAIASVADAVRLPLGDDASLPSHPPLIILDEQRSGQMLLRADNPDEIGRDISVRIEGPVHGSGRMMLGQNDVRFEKITLAPAKPSGSPAAEAEGDPSGLLRGEFQTHSGHTDTASPIVFAAVGEGFSHYQFDFDRDGANEWVLENHGLRLIFSPEDGGRGVALVDKGSGLNLTTTIGAFRDLFLAPSKESAAAAQTRDVTFNRAYRAEWVQEKNNTAIRLSYQMPDEAGPEVPAGAKIEKTIRLVANDTFEVDYRIAPARQPAGSATGSRPTFMAMTSLPVRSVPEHSTQFCWHILTAGESPAADNGQNEASPASTSNCEGFQPGAPALVLPEGAGRLEVRTLGRPTLALEWKTGKMVVERKQFAALLKLQFPPLEPGGEPGQYQVRYTVLPAD